MHGCMYSCMYVCMVITTPLWCPSKATEASKCVASNRCVGTCQVLRLTGNVERESPSFETVIQPHYAPIEVAKVELDSTYRSQVTSTFVID